MKPVLPNSPTAALEDALISHIKEKFKTSLKTVEALGGAWTEETIKQLIRVAPAAYIAFIGNSPSELPYCVKQTWVVFVSVDVLNGQRIEPKLALAMHDYMIAILHNHLFDCAKRAMQFSQSANLFSETASKRGLFVYGIYFTVDMPIPELVDVDSLDDFLTYHHRIKYDEHEGAWHNCKSHINYPLYVFKHDEYFELLIKLREIGAMK